MTITHNHFSDRAQRTITEIDRKAASAAKLLKDNPLAAIQMLGELRGKIEGLRSDVRVVAAERDAMERVAREVMDLPANGQPPHPVTTEPLIPVGNLDAAVEAEQAIDGEYLDYCRRCDEDAMVEDGIYYCE